MNLSDSATRLRTLEGPPPNPREFSLLPRDTLSLAPVREAKHFERRVVCKSRVPTGRLHRRMSEKPLQVALGNAATDRVGRERVLGAFVQRDVWEPGGLDSTRPDSRQ